MSKSDFYSESIQIPKSKDSLAPMTNANAPMNRTGNSTKSVKPNPTTGISDGERLYGRELRDCDDKDIEGLLSRLTANELEDLNNDFDPDNSLLPPHARCKDQTEKMPTGPYQREKLLQYLEEKAKTEKDWDECVPYCPGTKRGKVFESQDSTDAMTQEERSNSKTEMQMPIEIDYDDDDQEGTSDELLEKALDKLDQAPERDLVDLAGILGMHNVLNQTQFYNALKGKGQNEETGMSFKSVIKAYQPRVVPDEPENETDVDECIRKLETDDPKLEEININNMKRISKERIKTLIRTATKSKHLKKLSLANTAISDQEARSLVDLLEQNASIKVLNIESNFISPELIAKILRASLHNQSLVEFHAENQRASVLGNQIEMDIMLSVEDNENLLRVGVSLQSMEARNRVSEALERNYERLRLKRLENKTRTSK